MVSIVISSGHGLYVRGASGYIDEVDCARALVERIADYLRVGDDSTHVIVRDRRHLDRHAGEVDIIGGEPVDHRPKRGA